MAFCTHCMLGNFECFLLSSADFFSDQLFPKKSFMNSFSMSYSLDPDQARHFVGPDLGPKLLAKIISRRQKQVKSYIIDSFPTMATFSPAFDRVLDLD